jgi:hypothetical protein
VERKFNRLPVSTSSADPSNRPRAGSVPGPSLTTKAPRMSGRIGRFRNYGVRSPYASCGFFIRAGSNVGRTDLGVRRRGGYEMDGARWVAASDFGATDSRRR